MKTIKVEFINYFFLVADILFNARQFIDKSTTMKRLFI